MEPTAPLVLYLPAALVVIACGVGGSSGASRSSAYRSPHGRQTVWRAEQQRKEGRKSISLSAGQGVGGFSARKVACGDIGKKHIPSDLRP
jgi:hypothetical protein